jgi:hypothetical protein
MTMGKAIEVYLLARKTTRHRSDLEHMVLTRVDGCIMLVILT